MKQLWLVFFQAGENGDDSDGEYSDAGAEDTQMECYNTPLDDEPCPVDEYVAFKEILSSKSYQCYFFPVFIFNVIMVVVS